MFETYIIEYFDGDTYKTKERESGVSWGTLITQLGWRLRDQRTKYKTNIKWDNVTIWRIDKEGRQRLLKDDISEF